MPVSNIEKIKLRKKGSVRNDYIIGTSMGIGTGIIIGLANQGTGFEVYAVAGTLGIVGSLLGTPIGAIAGTKRYQIQGSLDYYNVYKSKLKEASIVKE